MTFPKNIARPIALMAGAGSEALMLYAGRRNDSFVLLALFTLWVLAPFVMLALSSRLRALGRTFYAVTLVVAAGSLAIYADVAFRHPRPKPASVFLAVPAVSWLLIAAVMLSSRSRRSPGE